MNDQRRNVLDRRQDAVLGRELGHQVAVGGVNPRPGRRLVVEELLMVGEVVPVMRNQQRGPAGGGERDHDPGHEDQSRQNPQHPDHGCGAESGAGSMTPITPGWAS